MFVQPKIASTTTPVRIVRCSLNTCMTTMAASTSGTAKKMSVMRERIVSTQPPKNPAKAPKVVPMSTTARVVSTPTDTEARAPWMVRE